jgi:DNA mismatch repair protein MutS
MIMAKYTPMIEQYLAIKADVQDAILLFRLGDFYEMFFEDAVRASKELDITLTGREGGAEERIPMCGVPHHSADNYISRLIEKGYKVAICEQVEDPAEAKGVVRREVVRIVTPGTVMDGKKLGEAANNFIVCAADHGDEYSLAACDLSTGELYVTAVSASKELLLDEVMVYNPSEMIGAEKLLTAIQSELAALSRPVTVTSWSKDDPKVFAAHFPSPETDRLSGAHRAAVSLLLTYLNETQKRSLSHIRHIEVYEQKQFMTLDPFTRRNLELVETVRDRTKKGSLLWMLDKTVTSMGGRLLRRWIDKPLMDKAHIERRLEAVGTLYHQLIVREDMRDRLKDVYDLERLVGRISFGSANARDLIALKSSLGQVPELKKLCEDAGSATLRELVNELDDCGDVMNVIEAAIVEDPPISIRDGGMIKQGFHTYLDQLREASVGGKRWIAELEKQEREATGIKSLKMGYNKVFGYYIEVTKANLASVPEGRYERKQTLANAERFVTPELKQKEALIFEAEDKMVGLEYELFTDLRTHIASQLTRLQKLAEIIAAIDVFQSLATVSAAQRYRQPQLEEDFDLRIEEGRHPVVEAVLSDGSFIANETQICEDGGRIMLITGPNMAGKSTYMRQVALICIMAQIGCFVPAKQARIPLIDRIFTRIGAADDLIGGQSTFMVEMADIQVMTEKATSRSLVIIDELGRGTSTGEGMAIAQAVIEFLHHQVGCKTLVSTHFHELAHLANDLIHLRNYCMAVKESGDRVTFLRKLVEGAASTSYGIYCARIAGLPESIIERSYALLHGFESRAAAEKARQETAASVVQLSLFEDAGAAAVKEKNKAGAKAEQIFEKIKTADLMNMTPLDAMNFIYELKKNI